MTQNFKVGDIVNVKDVYSLDGREDNTGVIQSLQNVHNATFYFVDLNVPISKSRICVPVGCLEIL